MFHEKMGKLKILLQKYNIVGYVVTSSDEYFNEYTPNRTKRLEYITNFTGSNGIAILTLEHNLFFTDGRYLTQSKKELDSSFQIFDIGDLKIFDFSKFFKSDDVIGYDPSIFTCKTIELFNNVKLFPIDENLIDLMWEDRPLFSNLPIYVQEEEFAGKSYRQKIEDIRLFLKQKDADHLLITYPEITSWLLNLRSSDIDYVPIILGNLIISLNQIYLFIDKNKINEDLLLLRPDIIIKQFEEFPIILENLTGKILYDENHTSIFVKNLLSNKNIENITNPCIMWKAQKNNNEIKYAIKFHEDDAIALCEFFAFIDYENLEKLTEYDLGLKLKEYRSRSKSYIMDSFHPICGFKENGAIIHYRATKDDAAKIEGIGLLLIDSGGQYYGATTDVTRTVAVGNATDIEKIRYTEVLKGHIALSSVKFPEATKGANLDILARQFLWQSGKDYPHGTGHGVGNFLNVHEGPQNINKYNNIPLKENMIISNEPGYYEEGHYGIRIENLIYVKKNNFGFLEFENLTLVPFDEKLIKMEMLTNFEIEYINNYYTKIKYVIYDRLSKSAKEWLDNKIEIIRKC